MTLLYSAIIFVNNDLSSSVQATLTSQLMLSEVIDGYEFDARVAADPNYPTEVHLNNLRVMVVRSFFDLTNRNLADITIFIKEGLAYIECNKIGPPGLTRPVARLQLEELIAPPFITRDCDHECDCHCRHKFPQYCGHTQSNILYPRWPERKIYHYPFGSDPICEKKK